MSEQKKNTMIKVASLWRGRTKDGDEYLSGSCSFRLLIFRNGSKKGAKSPDYSIFVDEQRPLDRPATEDASGDPNDQSEVDTF